MIPVVGLKTFLYASPTTKLNGIDYLFLSLEKKTKTGPNVV